MKKTLSTIALALLSSSTFAATQSTLPLKHLSVDYRLDFLQMPLKNIQSPIGMVGAHVLANLTPWFYAGMGAYGAVKGNDSGFFALGLDAGVHHEIYDSIWGDAGVYLGSGGGNGLASNIGNGGFLISHAGLGYDFGPVRVGANYSYVHFLDVDLNSHQVMMTLDVPVTFDYGLASYSNKELNDIKLVPNSSQLIFDNDYFAFTGQAYFPESGTKNLDGQIMDGHVGLVGIDYGHYLNPNTFLFIGMNGAVTGNKNGYAAALGGAGYSVHLGPQFKVSARLGAGSAGGGKVNMGGGFITSPSLSLEFDPVSDIGIEALGGFLWAPESGYKAWTAGLHLKYYFNIGHLGSGTQQTFNTYHFQKWRLRAGNQLYINPERETAADKGKKMNLLALKIDYFALQNLYFTGQTAFAYTGNAAGYFSGMVGLGLQSPTLWHTYVYGEILGGAAGGAHLKIGTGKMVEPLVGIGVQATPQLGVYGSIGKTYSPGNDLSTTTVDLGLSWRFATLNAS